MINSIVIIMKFKRARVRTQITCSTIDFNGLLGPIILKSLIKCELIREVPFNHLKLFSVRECCCEIMLGVCYHLYYNTYQDPILQKFFLVELR